MASTFSVLGCVLREKNISYNEEINSNKNQNIFKEESL